MRAHSAARDEIDPRACARARPAGGPRQGCHAADEGHAASQRPPVLRETGDQRFKLCIINMIIIIIIEAI